MTELDKTQKAYKAYEAYEAKFDESPPLMFLRGLSLEEQAVVINERVDDGKTFGEHATEEGIYS